MPYDRMIRATDAVPHIDALPTRQRTSYPEITDEHFWDFYGRAKDYSVVHIPGFFNVFTAMHHIARTRRSGAAVECGCFLGGMAIFMGLLRRHLQLATMEIVLFDTFRGAPAGSEDVVLGTPFVEPCELPSYRHVVPAHIQSALGSIEGYRFVEGLVENTLPSTDVGPVALLRLDTDYYSSTRIELEYLYPKLVAGGILIVDDYGMFAGARRATDEYLATLSNPPMLQRIDVSVWSGVKP